MAEETVSNLNFRESNIVDWHHFVEYGTIFWNKKFVPKTSIKLQILHRKNCKQSMLGCVSQCCKTVKIKINYEL